MTDGIVFANRQGKLGDLDGATVGVVALVLDDFATDLIGTMEFVSELSAWFVDGDPRGTADLVYGLEPGDYGTDGVVRYLDGIPPELDLSGVAEVNAVAYYDTTGADDTEHTLHFALPAEPGPGFAGWPAGEPADGLARVGVPAPDFDVLDGGSP